MARSPAATTYNAAIVTTAGFANPANNLRAPLTTAPKDFDQNGLVDALFMALGDDTRTHQIRHFDFTDGLELVDDFVETDPAMHNGVRVG